MYVSISQEVSRQHRQEIMKEVWAARQARTAHANRDRESRLVRDLGWELSRYAGLLGIRFGR